MRSGQLQATLDGMMEEAGFARRGSSYYRSLVEVTQVLGMQNHTHRSEVFLIAGIWINELGEETFPPAYRCHVSARCDGWHGILSDELEEMLEEEQDWKVDRDFLRFELFRLLKNLEDQFYSKQTTLLEVGDFLRVRPSPAIGSSLELREMLGVKW